MAKRQQAAAQGKGFGLLFEMGCGKTLTAIAIAGAAYEKGAIEKVLVGLLRFAAYGRRNLRTTRTLNTK